MENQKGKRGNRYNSNQPEGKNGFVRDLRESVAVGCIGVRRLYSSFGGDLDQPGKLENVDGTC